MSRLLTEEELTEAYMGSDYHPAFKLFMGVKHGVERVADAEHKETLKAVGKAINDYAHNKISFERLAELLEISLYDLDVAFHKRGEMSSDIYKAVGKWLEGLWTNPVGNSPVTPEEIACLLRGEMPEEGK